MDLGAVLGRAFGGGASGVPDDATATKILDATVGACAAQGIGAVTIDGVARRAGVNRVTVYRRFGDRDALLQAIKDGHAYGTISQQPWKYGYQSVRVLKALVDGDTSVIPENKFIDVGYKIVTKENIDEFWAEKNKMAELGAQK